MHLLQNLTFPERMQELIHIVYNHHARHLLLIENNLPGKVEWFQALDHHEQHLQ